MDRSDSSTLPSPQALREFTDAVWAYYRAHRRDMPWRADTSLYSVIVSEIMLQQTQVSRVMVKFASWMKRFPDWKALAKAPTKAVLAEWSGLGYNRRALYLKRIAEAVVAAGPKERFDTAEKLTELPGIGPNTAGAVLAYTYNIPHAFIETNIRSVLIHFFFEDAEVSGQKVRDRELAPIIEELLKEPGVAANPREWHWALMDYGAYLKRGAASGGAGIANPSRQSAHHAKQSRFEGSNRQLRSAMLKSILEQPRTLAALEREFAALSKGPRMKTVAQNIQDLVREGFIAKKGSAYLII